MLLLCEVRLAACWYQMFNIMRWGMFLGNKRQTIQSAVWNLFSQPFFYCTCSPVFLYATVFLSLRCFFPSSFLLSLPPPSLPLFLLCLWVSFLVFSLLPLCSSLPCSLFLPEDLLILSRLCLFHSLCPVLINRTFPARVYSIFSQHGKQAISDGFEEKNGDQSLNGSWSRERSQQIFVCVSCHETRFNFKYLKKKMCGWR